MNTPFMRYCTWVLAAVSLCLLFISIPYHDFYVDEAFIGEYAYFFARDGYVHSHFWEGYLRQDNTLFFITISPHGWCSDAETFSVCIFGRYVLFPCFRVVLLCLRFGN